MGELGISGGPAAVMDIPVQEVKESTREHFSFPKKFAHPIWISHIMAAIYSHHPQRIPSTAVAYSHNQLQNHLSLDYGSLRQTFHLIAVTAGVFS